MPARPAPRARRVAAARAAAQKRLLRRRRPCLPRPWAARLAPGQRLAVAVPEGRELLVVRACLAGLAPDAAAEAGALELTCEGRSAGTFRVRPWGTAVRARLTGDSGCFWRPEVRPGDPAFSVDLSGYLAQRAGRAARGHRAAGAGAPAGAKRSVPSGATAEVREVRLPAGWAGLSLRLGDDGRLTVADVPKACFSSAKFAAEAGPQVQNVSPGDEVVSINGVSPQRLAERIATPGDALNTCSAGPSAHRPGSVGKLDPDPCVSCDVVRRQQSLGLDVALQMWMKTVKRDTPIVLGVVASAERAGQPPRESGGPAKAARSIGAVVEAGASRSLAGAPQLPRPAACQQAATPARQKASAPARQGAYNPLRPAAAHGTLGNLAAAGPAGAQAAAAKAVKPALTKAAGGLSYEDLSEGSGAETARKGQAALLKFTLRQAGAKQKVVERGEIKVCLGKSEVMDGWVDGNVDMEEVLGTWGSCLVGTRVGGCRRVHVPPGKGFRHCGGEAAPSTASLLFDAELKRLM